MVRKRVNFIWALFSVLWPMVVVAQPAQYVPGEIIVKLKGSGQPGTVSPGGQAFLGKASSGKGMTLKGAYSRMNVYHYSLKAGQNVEEAVKEILADPEVEYAEPNYIFSKFDVGGVVQSFSSGQVASMAGSGGYLATGAPIQVPNTWSSVTPNGTPVVAVIDTGMDVGHSVFSTSQAVWTNPGEIPGNNVDDDHNGFVDDVHGWNFVNNSGSMIDDDGHGTHVAGIILGTTQDIYNPPLPTAKVKIMPLKFLDGSGYGKTSDAIKAIYYAVNNGASILNNSWGGSSYSSALHEAIVYAYSAGVVFVAAAGNNGRSNDSNPIYPANYDVPNVVTVAATTDSDALAYFSNFSSSRVHIASPGVFILSTLPRDSYGNNTYGSMSGTSMATPFVTGLAALIKIEQPTMLAYQVKQIILDGADIVTDGSGHTTLENKVSTSGRMNVYNSVLAAKTAAVDATQPGYSYTSLGSSSTTMAGGCGTVHKMISDMGKGKGGGSTPGLESWSALFVLALFLLPMIIYNILRRRDPGQRRQHERFRMNTEVKVKFGDRELVGSIATISQGGVQINTDALIEQGGIVSMAIRSPDGKEQIVVEGRVVWSEEKKAYGVQFAETSHSIRERISLWSKSLVKA